MKKFTIILFALSITNLFYPTFFSWYGAQQEPRLRAHSSQRYCPELTNGGPPKDGIPAIDEPKFISASEFEDQFSNNYLQSSIILGMVIDGTPHAYPLDILTWHEIINHPRDEHSLSVTYCPLTGSGIAFNTSAIQDSTLGTTGQLLENNLVFYDRLSDTYWSQMLTHAWCGPLVGSLPIIPIFEMSWNEWVQIYPETIVLSRDTGFRRDYNRNPYGEYGITESILFQSAFNPLIPQHGYYHPKSLTHVAFIDNETILFPLSELENSRLILFEINNQSYVLYSKESSVGIFSTTSIQNRDLILTVDQIPLNDPQIIFEDKSGTSWNLNGEAIKGPYTNDKLVQIPSYNAYWFSAIVFFGDEYIFLNNTLSKSHFEITPVPTPNYSSYFDPVIPLLLVLTIVVVRKKKQ
ncbi:MAG: DUF3179 domain-containing protein [Candidatus Hodarchaeales archaeon]|jgi:hypothetical protein